MIRDKREARAAIKLSDGGNQPPPDVDQLKLREMTSDFAEEASEGGSDTSSVQKLAESLSVIVETLQLCFERQEQRKRQKRVSGPKIPPLEVCGRAHRRMWRAIVSRGRSQRKQEEPLKAQGERQRQRQRPRQKWRKGQRQGIWHQMLRVGGIGHPAGLCPSEGWVNDLEQDAPEGENTNEEGCWTEEDDETLQLEYLGSDSCLTSFPHQYCVMHSTKLDGPW